MIGLIEIWDINSFINSYLDTLEETEFTAMILVLRYF